MTRTKIEYHQGPLGSCTITRRIAGHSPGRVMWEVSMIYPWSAGDYTEHATLASARLVAMVATGKAENRGECMGLKKHRRTA